MSNITLEASSFSEQLGVYDFLNVLVSGAIFVFGMCALNTEVNIYLFGNLNVAGGVGIVLLIYISGIVLQEIATIWDEKIALYTGMSRNILKGYIGDRSAEAIGSDVVKNPYLLKQYRKYASEIIGEEFPENENDPIFQNGIASGAMFSVCQYYVAVSGCDKKVEKMRALYEMSKTMMIAFSALALFGLFTIGTNVMASIDFLSFAGLSACHCSIWLNKLLLTICFFTMAYLLYCRARKIMRKFLLILLGTYDAIKRAEKQQKDSRCSNGECITCIRTQKVDSCITVVQEQ